MKDCYIHPTLRQLLDELDALDEPKPLNSYRQRPAEERQRLMRVWWHTEDDNIGDDS